LVDSFTIIRTEEFIRASSSLIEAYPTLIEFNKFLNWHLQKDPYRFERDTGDYYTLSSSDLQTPDLLLAAKRVTLFPNVKVLYRIDQEQRSVTLMSISIV